MILELLAGYFAIRTIEQVIALHNVNLFLKKELSVKKIILGQKKKIFIIIPVLNEKKIISETVLYYKKELSHLPVVYVTTQKEGSLKNNETVKAIKKTCEDAQIIHYPRAEGNKASQVNYALTLLEDKIALNDYVAVFDADSRPGPEMFEKILCDKETPKAYQAFSNYFLELNSKNKLAQANAVYQTRWTYTFEMKNMINNYYKKRKNFMYVIGHGLFIQKNVWNRFSFPEESVTEDIMYGYRLNIANIYPKPLPYFDFCTVPNSAAQAIKQSGRWFSGELSFFKIIKPTRKSIFAYLNRLTYLLQWAFGPPVLLFLLFSAIRTNNSIVLLTVLGTLIVYLYGLHFQFIRTVKKNHLFFTLWFKGLLDCIGPFYGICKFIRKKLSKKEINFEKAAR